MRAGSAACAWRRPTTTPPCTGAWRGDVPRSRAVARGGGEACFACLSFPLAHRVRVRTTDRLERFQQELKRHTRIVRISPNRAACLRLVTTLCAEQSDAWVSGRRYLGPAGPSSQESPWTMPGRAETMQVAGL